MQADTDSENDAPDNEAEGESRRSTRQEEGGNAHGRRSQTCQTQLLPDNIISSTFRSNNETPTHESQALNGLDFSSDTASLKLAFQTQTVLQQQIATAFSSSAGMSLGYFPYVPPHSVAVTQPQPISNGMFLQVQEGYEATLRQQLVGLTHNTTAIPMITGGGVSTDNYTKLGALTINHLTTIHKPVMPNPHPNAMGTSTNSEVNPNSHLHQIPIPANSNTSANNAEAPEAHASANIIPTRQHQAVPVAPTSTIPMPIPMLPTPVPIQQPLTVQDSPNPPIYNGVNPNYPGLQVIHQNPPIFAVSDFLTSTECDFLTCVAQDCFTPAPVVGKGAGEVTPSRTSSTCYLAREDLPEYLRKVSLLTGKPVDHCELPQVGRYFPSQQYLQHFDAFDLSNEDGRRFAQNGGQRTVTVLVYLNDVQLGGQTAFPALNLEVQPKKGMALVFFPATVDGLLDKSALHAAKPAIDTKYVSQVWIRQSTYQGLPSKRMFSSVEQASIVQKSLICAREGGSIEFGSMIGGITANSATRGNEDSFPHARQ